ncbi:MAG TPA: DNA ligase D [Chitinophagaceae bacterium]|jgi:bifunctional non-homologous end joining protein LigD|nr:DNA ligase D [Chitinophagaceae bacterium]
MLTTLVDEAFDGEDWLFEIKWDGYRAIASILNNKVELYSRNNISFNKRYPEVVNALSEWSVNAVIDGEVVALDEHGHSKFQYLQNWLRDQQGSLVYYVFDILWLEGYDLTQLSLIQRKNILQQVIPVNDIVRYSDHIEKNGIHFFEAAKEKDLEGIIAKNKKSTYETDTRSKSWLKIKTTFRQEAVIVGFTEPSGSRPYFGALVLGIYEDGKLEYAGHTGSGFNQKLLKDVWTKLQPLIINECPLDIRPKTRMPATWIKPKLVCEIKFQEWTQDHIMRVPVFMGLRTDKKPTEVKKEKLMATKKIQKRNGLPTRRPGKKQSVAKNEKTSPNKNEKNKRTSSTKKLKASSEWLDENEKELSVKLNGHELKLTNLDKIYWKKESYTKRDLLNYYHAIAPYILPYMKNRPQSLNRHPNGIDGMSFFQKNVQGKVADWIETFDDYSESTRETVHYFVCTNEASLIYLANLGCIEMNPWHSTIAKPDSPDYCLIDLDPHEINFDKVIETAVAVKKVLEDLKIPAWCKTSGSSGIHICIPLGAKYNYEQSKHLAELIANLVHHEVPEFTSVERQPAKRRRKVYLDFLQNAKSQTVACVYSVRPKPEATVSTPIFWEELKKGLSPANFTMKNIFERLKTEGDIFKPVYEKGIDLKKTLATVESVL